MADQASLAHLVARITADVDFLASQGALSQSDRTLITSKLSSASLSSPASTSSLPQLERQISGLSVTGARAVPPPPAPKPAALEAPAPAAAAKKAKAIWAYAAAQTDDLAFKEGDVITIVQEENADWWRGELDGRTGLFPSNHVERLPDSTPTPQRFVPPPPAHTPSFSSQTSGSYASSQNQHYGEKQPYAYQQQQQPPYAMQPYQYTPSPPPGQQAVVVQEEQKKKRFGGKLGGQMASAAAGGVGFGAGAAVGSGIINSIF